MRAGVLTVRMSRDRQINEDDRRNDYINTKMTTSRQMINGEPNVHDERGVPRIIRMAKIKGDEQKLDGDNGSPSTVPLAPRQNP